MQEKIYEETVPYYTRLSFALGYTKRANLWRQTAGHQTPLTNREAHAFTTAACMLIAETADGSGSNSIPLTHKGPSIVTDTREALDLPEKLSDDNVRSILVIASVTLMEVVNGENADSANMQVTYSVLESLYSFARNKVAQPGDIEYPRI